MKYYYPVLIKRTANFLITELTFPDFNYIHQITDAAESTTDEQQLPQLINHILSGYILQVRQKYPIPFPKHIEKYQEIIPMSRYNQWYLCPINDRLFIKFFEKMLPPFGVFSSIIAALTMAVIDFATMDTELHTGWGFRLGIAGAILSATMAIIIYYYSEATNVSKIIGRKLDNLRCARKHNEPQDTPNISSKHWLNVLSKILLTFIPLLTTVFSSYNHYNQVTAIDETILSKKAFNTLALVMIIFSSYSKFIFQVSFLPPLYRGIDQLGEKCCFFPQQQESTNPHDVRPLLVQEGNLIEGDSDSELVP